MRYEFATPSQLDAVSRYLLDREEYWTGLTEKLKRRGALAIPTGSERLLVARDGSAISGIIYNDGRGYTFPALKPPVTPRAVAAFQQAVAGLPRVLTLLGNSHVVDAAVSARRRKPAFRVDYLLMARAAGPPHNEADAPRGLAITPAGPSSARALYPLQKAYEIEEVLLEPDRFNPLICMSRLKETLKNQIVLQASLQGRVVAKAGTNARGVNWAQIGGVFTLPELRGQGIGRAVMNRLLELLDETDLGASLFVKPENEAAVRLYRGIGFRELGPFSIAYYLR